MGPHQSFKTFVLQKMVLDFPLGSVVKTSPSSAEGTSLIPGRRTKIPHATGQLSPCTTNKDPLHYN